MPRVHLLGLGVLKRHHLELELNSGLQLITIFYYSFISINSTHKLPQTLHSFTKRDFCSKVDNGGEIGNLENALFVFSEDFNAQDTVM